MNRSGDGNAPLEVAFAGEAAKEFLGVAEFARIQIVRGPLNSDEFSYRGACLAEELRVKNLARCGATNLQFPI